MPTRNDECPTETMAEHERNGLTDEWYTPAWIFRALGIVFDLDPCAAVGAPAWDWCLRHELANGLDVEWRGSVWLNPPFGGRNGIRPWLDRLAQHGHGIAIVPNRTATDWWQDAAGVADALLFVRKKIRFLRPDGSEGVSPGYGNVLMAFGKDMAEALRSSEIRGIRT